MNVGTTYLPNFGNGILIDRYLCVNSCTRIAVPVPNAAQVCPGFENLALEAELVSKAVEQIHTTEPSAGNQHVEIEVVLVAVVCWRCLGVHGANVRT